MFHLIKALKAWNTAAFASQLQQDIEQLDAQQLPLQQGLSNSSYALADPLQALLLNSRETAEAIHVKVALFYAGVIAGCNCADDPTPLDTQPEYCEVWIQIDKQTAAATVVLAGEDR